MYARFAPFVCAFTVAFAAAVNPWISEFRNLLDDCPVSKGSSFIVAISRCARIKTLTAIDVILDQDIVPIFNGLDLVKFTRVKQLQDNARIDNSSLTLRDILRKTYEKGSNMKPPEADNWGNHVLNSLARTLKTHAFRIDFDEPRHDELDFTASQVQARGRRRRKKQMQILPIVLMSILLMSTVLIPMGFQFLAVLGGKALLLAKMALMLSSIQGLKKIATSGLNYGLHYAPSEAWHERSNGLFDDSPYSVGSTVAGSYHPGEYNYLGTGHQFIRRSGNQPT